MPGDKPSDLTFDITVPAGRLWVMGDHRSDSADSRVPPRRPRWRHRAARPTSSAGRARPTGRCRGSAGSTRPHALADIPRAGAAVSGTPRDGDAGWLRYEGDRAGAGRRVDAGAQRPAGPGTPPTRPGCGTTCPGPGAPRRRRRPPPGPRRRVAGARGRRRRPSSRRRRSRTTPASRRRSCVEAEESTPAHVHRPPSRSRQPATTARRPTPPSRRSAADGLDAVPPTRRRRSRCRGRRTRRGDDAGRHGRRSRRRRRRRAVGGLAVLGAAVKEFAIVVGMALVLSFVVKTWLLQAFYIPSGSMEDTLVLNDRVIVSKLTPGPIDLKRGDIIVFADPGQWLDADARRSSTARCATVVTDDADLRRACCPTTPRTTSSSGSSACPATTSSAATRAAGSPSTARRSRSPTSSPATRRASRTSTSPCRAGGCG